MGMIARTSRLGSEVHLRDGQPVSFGRAGMVQLRLNGRVDRYLPRRAFTITVRDAETWVFTTPPDNVLRMKIRDLRSPREIEIVEGGGSELCGFRAAEIEIVTSGGEHRVVLTDDGGWESPHRISDEILIATEPPVPLDVRKVNHRALIALCSERPVGYNERTRCKRIHERVWEDDRLVKDEVREICEERYIRRDQRW